jgi:hypothetical protein
MQGSDLHPDALLTRLLAEDIGVDALPVEAQYSDRHLADRCPGSRSMLVVLKDDDDGLLSCPTFVHGGSAYRILCPGRLLYVQRQGVAGADDAAVPLPSILSLPLLYVLTHPCFVCWLCHLVSSLP